MAIVRYTTAYPFRAADANRMLCPYCLKEFRDATIYRRHMRKDHAKPDPQLAFSENQRDYGKIDITNLKCRICRKKFYTLSLIAEHINQKHTVDFEPSSLRLQPYKFDGGKAACGVCDEIFLGISQVSKHLPSHYLTCTCSVCGKSFMSNGILQRHIALSHPEKKYACHKCLKSFDTEEERRRHVDENRSCWQYCCTICPERFKSYTTRKKHLIDVHDQPVKTITCHCGEEFESAKKYRLHGIKVHNILDFSCNYCAKKFGDKGLLVSHLVVHTKEKKFLCAVCNKKFPRKRNLNQHMWIHKEAKRFECKPCDKKFNQRVSYKTHMRSYHPEVDIG